MNELKNWLMKILTIMSWCIIIPLTTAQTDDVTLELRNNYLPIIDGNTIIETELLFNNTYKGFMDYSECELDIYNNIEQEYEINYRSLTSKGDGIYTFQWNNIHNGIYTLIQYCQYGDILNQDKIYLYVTIEVSGV